MQTGKFGNALQSEKHASLLRHSNIVKVLMIEQGTSLSLITMELCGITLQDRSPRRGSVKQGRKNFHIKKYYLRTAVLSQCWYRTCRCETKKYSDFYRWSA